MMQMRVGTRPNWVWTVKFAGNVGSLVSRQHAANRQSVDAMTALARHDASRFAKLFENSAPSHEHEAVGMAGMVFAE